MADATPSQSSTSGAPVRVLAVCTANICRSPAVERLLRLGLDNSAQVSSAGVMALVGEPIDPPVAAFLQAVGAEASGFAARQVTERHLREADLVLALTRAHRARVLTLAPAAVRRTFTLLEFARILASLDLTALPLEQTPQDRLRQILPLVTAGRAFAPRPVADADDVPDPYARGAASYQRSLTLIRDATDTIVRLVRPL